MARRRLDPSTAPLSSRSRVNLSQRKPVRPLARTALSGELQCSAGNSNHQNYGTRFRYRRSRSSGCACSHAPCVKSAAGFWLTNITGEIESASVGNEIGECQTTCIRNLKREGTCECGWTCTIAADSVVRAIHEERKCSERTFRSTRSCREPCCETVRNVRKGLVDVESQ